MKYTVAMFEYNRKTGTMDISKTTCGTIYETRPEAREALRTLADDSTPWSQRGGIVIVNPDGTLSPEDD